MVLRIANTPESPESRDGQSALMCRRVSSGTEVNRPFPWLVRGSSSAIWLVTAREAIIRLYHRTWYLYPGTSTTVLRFIGSALGYQHQQPLYQVLVPSTPNVTKYTSPWYLYSRTTTCTRYVRGAYIRGPASEVRQNRVISRSFYIQLIQG